jgi:hypothetical protein
MALRGFACAVVATFGAVATAGGEGVATTPVIPSAELDSGGKAALGYGGKAALGYGGKAALGYGGKAALGYGGKAALGYGGKAALGYRGKAALGYGGKAALGYGRGTAIVWGQLNPRLASGWARTQGMKRGYLEGLTRSLQTKHAAFAEHARGALAALNASYGSCGGLWPNLRLSLATVLAAAPKAHGAQLGLALSRFTHAIGSACSSDRRSLATAAKALQSATRALRGKATTSFLRALSNAAMWLKKPSLWKPHAKKGAKR